MLWSHAVKRLTQILEDTPDHPRDAGVEPEWSLGPAYLVHLGEPPVAGSIFRIRGLESP